MTQHKLITELGKIMAASRRMLAFTGAGISTESAAGSWLGAGSFAQTTPYAGQRSHSSWGWMDLSFSSSSWVM